MIFADENDTFAFAESDIIRIYAELFAYNTASCRVPEKAGFGYRDFAIALTIRHIF